MASFSFDDLRAVSRFLADKPYYLGSEASTVDCTLFGHLAQFLFIPMDFPQKSFLYKECPNVVKFVDRMKTEFWPDWDAMCKRECMEGRMGKKIFE